jgi:hypothetical protein
MVISTSDVKRLLSTKRGDEGDIELVVQALGYFISAELLTVGLAGFSVTIERELYEHYLWPIESDKDGSTMAVIYLELKEMCAAEGWDLVMGDDLCLIVGPIK